MRASINNYIIRSDIDSIIENKFNLGRSGDFNFAEDLGGGILNKLTYKEDGGIYVYGCVGDNCMVSAASCNTGEGCYSYGNPTRKVILNEGTSFNPKDNDSDLIKLRGTGMGQYKGAQRGETITIRVESKMSFSVMLFGYNVTVGIPLSVTKSAPAMYYYRI